MHHKGKDKEELRSWNSEIQFPNTPLLIEVHRHLAVGRLAHLSSFHVSLPFQPALKNSAFQIFNCYLQKKSLIGATGKMEARLRRIKKPHTCWEEWWGKEQVSLTFVSLSYSQNSHWSRHLLPGSMLHLEMCTWTLRSVWSFLVGLICTPPTLSACEENSKFFPWNSYYTVIFFSPSIMLSPRHNILFHVMPCKY